tara:strand:- start:923 stop:1102 length:180 start_codon:yes stop_codon:yes gene_type:complete
MELIDFQNKKWVVKSKVDGSRIDNPSTLKKSYGCDLVIRNSQNIYFILDEVIDVEFEDI